MKTLYFIRHAEAVHNPPAKLYGKGILNNWKFFDAKLTELGEKQCELLGDRLPRSIEIFYVSPLMRTLQTATLAKLDKLVALEEIRERLGQRPCDKRNNISHQQQLFPTVNFFLCKAETDELWLKDHRETEEELLKMAIIELRQRFNSTSKIFIVLNL